MSRLAKYVAKLCIHHNWGALIFLFAIGAILVDGYDCYGQKYLESQQKFSFSVDNRPLTEVVQLLSRLSGYQIDIDQTYSDIPITIELKGVDLNYALMGVMQTIRITNHALLMDENSKTVKILIFPSINDVSFDSINSADISSHTAMNRSQNEITAEQVEQIKKDFYSRMPSPQDIVSPPAEDGRPGITREQLRNIKENYQIRKRQMSKDTIVSPPSVDGKPGITMAELEEIKRAHKLRKKR